MKRREMLLGARRRGMASVAALTQSAQALAQTPASAPAAGGHARSHHQGQEDPRDGRSDLAAVRHPRPQQPARRLRDRDRAPARQGSRRRARARAGHGAAAHSRAAGGTRRRRHLVAVDHLRSREDGDVRAAAWRAFDRHRRRRRRSRSGRRRHGRQEDRAHPGDARGGDASRRWRRPARRWCSSTTSPRRCRR